MTASPILALEGPLVAEFERESKGPRIAQILGDYAQAHSDWSRYALFERESYTRNLIARNGWFELLLLCWDVGQESPIHNHAGQNCWMAVLEGEIEELQFDCPVAGRVDAPTARGTRVFVPGKVAFINDEIALHRVRPRPGLRGVSLHLYSRPIETCNLYDERTGQVVVRRMSYHSVRGNRVLV